MKSRQKVGKYIIPVLLVTWLLISLLFSEKLGTYFASFSPQISEGEASIDYYSEDNNQRYALNSGEILSLPVQLEKRLARIGIYIGAQSDSTGNYIFQLEDDFGSILGKTSVALADIKENQFVYITSRSIISNEGVYYIKIFSETSTQSPLYLNTSLASAFQTAPFQIEGIPGENTLILDKRYEDVNSKRIILYVDLVLIGAVLLVWIIGTARARASRGGKKRAWDAVKRLPWKRVLLLFMIALAIADIVVICAKKTEYLIQFGNGRTRDIREFSVPLQRGKVLEQYLAANEGTVDSISFLFATYKQTIEDGAVYVELWNDTDAAKIYSGHLNTESLLDNTYQYFRLDTPLQLSGKALRIRVWAEYAGEEDCIAVYANKNVTQTMFAEENGKRLDGSLIFDLSKQVRSYRTGTAIVFNSLLLAASILYIWRFAKFKKEIFRYSVSAILASVLFLAPVLSFVNYREVSVNGMKSSLMDLSKWENELKFGESELLNCLSRETEYDFKGVPLIAYERTELPINGAVSNIEMHFRGSDMVKKDYDIQVYWNTGDGYSESQSYTYKYVHQDKNELTFPIPCSQPVRSIMLNVGMTGDRFTGVELPDRILPLTSAEINTHTQDTSFFPAKILTVFFGIFCLFMAAHLWKYFDLDKKLSSFCARKRISISAVFVVIALIMGISMSFLIPTLQVPDERAHISGLYSDMGDSHTESLLLDTLGDQGLQGVMLNAGQIVDASAYIDASSRQLEDYHFGGGSPSLRMIRRPGQVLGVTIGQLLHLPAYWILQLGELGALALYIAIGALTLKVIPFKKNLMMMIMLLPVAMQEAGSLSYDSFNNALSFFTIAYILHLKVRAEKVSWMQLVVLAILAIGLLIGKVIYVLLLGLVFIIPIHKLEIKLGGVKQITINAAWIKHHRVAVISFVLVGICACAAVSFTLLDNLGYGEINKMLWGYIISLPQLIRLCVSTCAVHWQGWLRGLVAALGNYDVPVNEIITWIGLISLFVIAMIHHEKSSVQKVPSKHIAVVSFSCRDLLVWYGILIILFISVLMTMISWGFFIYGIDSSLPYSVSMRLLPRIEGVQGRYFFPILPLLFIPIHAEKDYLRFIPAGLYKICYYLLMTIYPITLLLMRYWGIGSW